MRRKVLYTFGTLCLVSILVSIYVIYSIERATHSVDRLLELHRVADLRDKMLHEIEIVQEDLHLKQTRYARDLAELVSHVSEMSNTVDTCFDCHHNREVVDRLNSLREDTEVYKTALSRVYTLRANSQRIVREEDNAFLAGEELIGKVEAMLAFTNRNLEIKTQEILKGVNRSKDLLLVFTIIAPIVAFGMVLWFYLHFTRPVTALLDATGRLKKGELDYRVEKLDDEFGEVARSFNEMADSLKEMMHTMLRAEQMVLMGEMASRLAHEIKNPITGIKLAAEVIRDEVGLEGEYKDLCMKTIDQIHNIERLMKGLLDYARPPASYSEKQNINRIIETAYSTVEIIVKKRAGAGKSSDRIRMVKELEEDLPEILTDATQVQQILLNLMLNAVDAMYQGGTLTVKSYMDSGGRCIQVEVSDTGTGIDPSLGEKIFQPFFSTKVKGTGLGLATVRRLVELNRGEIHFTSEVGVGSTFSVCFPMNPEKGCTQPC